VDVDTNQTEMGEIIHCLPVDPAAIMTSSLPNGVGPGSAFSPLLPDTPNMFAAGNAGSPPDWSQLDAQGQQHNAVVSQPLAVPNLGDLPHGLPTPSHLMVTTPTACEI